jgi:hypothetical protein
LYLLRYSAAYFDKFNWRFGGTCLLNLHRQRKVQQETRVTPTFADRGCYVVSVTDPYGHRLKPRLVLLNNSSVIFTRQSGPRYRPTTSQKTWQRRESHTDLCICSQELWQLDNRGGLRIRIISSSFILLCGIILQPKISLHVIRSNLFVEFKEYWHSECWLWFFYIVHSPEY